MLMNFETFVTDGDDDSIDSSSSCSPNETNTIEQAKINDGDLGDYLDPDFTLACQTNKFDPFGVRSRPTSSSKTPNGHTDCLQCKNSSEEAVLKLKESTKKLLCVLEEIQSKIHAKNLNRTETHFNFSQHLKQIPSSQELLSVTDLINKNAIKRLTVQAQTMDSINIQDEDDDCSVYKRLTRKCNCLNHQEYNDFVIHFNEDTKYRTSIAGEIIKNMRILKKFLYMNGNYTKNALLFLNEGLGESSYTEKVDITQGCAHADACNIFDDHSIVTKYISWPCKNEYCGDAVTQALTASFIYKLAQLEEGRRYLNFSSKITNDIKKVLKKKVTYLEFETVELLNSTLNLLMPPLAQNINMTHYCKPIDEGVGKKTVNVLIDHRQYMTLDEVFTHLDLLHTLSNRENGKYELMTYLPTVLVLFKALLIEFDNSEMNIIITNILNNIVSKNMVNEKEQDFPKTLIIADIGTEPIQMKNEMNQYPPKKSNAKKITKSKIGLGISPNKHRNSSKRSEAKEPQPTSNWESSKLLNCSRKFIKDHTGSSIIVVPIEKK